jgi:hypothetical protein
MESSARPHAASTALQTSAPAKPDFARHDALALGFFGIIVACWCTLAVQRFCDGHEFYLRYEHKSGPGTQTLVIRNIKNGPLFSAFWTETQPSIARSTSNGWAANDRLAKSSTTF